MDKVSIVYEKNLYDILRTYSESIETPKIRPGAELAAAISVLLSILYWMLGGDPNLLRLPMRELAGLLVAVGAASLGMVVAGFAIVASSLDVKLIRIMSRFPYPRKQPMINFLFSLFVVALLVPLVSIGVGFFYYLLPLEGTLTGGFLLLVNGELRLLLIWAATIVYITLLIRWAVTLLLTLKSFIFNVHQSLIFVSALKILDEASQ